MQHKQPWTASLKEQLYRYLQPFVFVGTSFIVLMGSPLHVNAEEEVLPVLESQAELFKEGWNAANRGDMNAAEKIWTALSKEKIMAPELVRALNNNLAVVMMKKKAFEEAERQLKTALSADEQMSITLANLNQIYSYQAQKAYQKVFSETVVTLPQGEFLYFDIEKVAEATDGVVTALPEFSANAVGVETKASVQVRGLVNEWARAWSDQNHERYVSYYDEQEFSPPRGVSFNTWKQGRHRSLTNPKFINITMDDLAVVQLNENYVRVRFLQHYESDRFNDSIYKVLLWQQIDGQWKIVQEMVVYGKASTN